MKNILFSALALATTTLTFTPVASAAEIFPSISIQRHRLEALDTQTKAVDNIQKVRFEHLNNQTKAIENIQESHLDFLNN